MNPILSYLYPFQESWVDYPDNESLALSIYFLGCEHNCVGCSNPELQDKLYNHPHVHIESTIKHIIDKIYSDANRSCTNKLVFIGGDPFFSLNIDNTKNILKKLQFDFDMCVYTGYSVEYAQNYNVSGFKFLKTGVYKQDLSQISEKTDEYMQFASKNQKLYDSNFQLLSNDGRYYFKQQ